MEAFNAALELPKSWKQFLDMPYPSVPEDAKADLAELFPHPLPPLEFLCPPRCFTIRPWDSPISNWCTHLPDRAVAPDTARYWRDMSHLFYGIKSALCNPGECYMEFHLSQGITRPEGMLLRWGIETQDEELAIFINDPFNLPHRLDQVLNRLFVYMKLSNTCYGAVSCWSSTWLCKAERDESSGEAVLLVSPPHDRMGMAFGFLIFTALNDSNCGFPTVVETPKEGPLPKFDMEPIMYMLSRSSTVLSNDDMKRKIVDGVTTLRMEELRDFTYLPVTGESRVPKSQVSMRGIYKGGRIVVRTRDLSSPVLMSYSAGLLMFIVEVNAYLVLRKLQGKMVPKLLSWGFMEGGMFAFIMMEDGGLARIEADKAGESWIPERKAALMDAMKVLGEIHKRGILHGDISVSKIVAKVDGDRGKWRVMMVGFGQSREATVLSPKWLDGVTKETTQLQNIVDVLTKSQPPPPPCDIVPLPILKPDPVVATALVSQTTSTPSGYVTPSFESAVAQQLRSPSLETD